MADSTSVQEATEHDLPDATIFRPGGTKGWTPPNVPAIVSVQNNRQGDNPTHARGKYQVKRGANGSWTTETIIWGQTDNFNTNREDFRLKNNGDVILSVNP